MDKTLQELAEHYLGSAITPSEWKKAKAESVHKLAFIIDQEGDSNGTRREPWYLARLIAEAVGVERFSEALRELTQPYCSTAKAQMQ